MFYVELMEALNSKGVSILYCCMASVVLSVSYHDY